MPKQTEIDALLKEINKDFGDGRIVIQRGRDIGWSSAKRYSTGSLGLDIALNGGVPRGMIVQFVGEESSGKTTMAFKVASTIQDLYGEDAAIAFIAVEGFDKKWANQCGCAVPFTKEEIRLMPEEEQEIFAEVKEAGQFVVAQATTGEDALELALRFIRSGKFQLVIIDSIAALVPASEEEREMSQDTMGTLPRLVGKFLRKCASALSVRLDDDKPNETAVILINQVRDQIGVYGHPEPQPPGGRALRHWSVANVRFKRGELLKAAEKEADSKNPMIYGKRTKIRIEKCKIGPPYREAEFDFYFREYNGFRPGDIDSFEELRKWAVKCNLIRQTSNVTYEYQGEKFRGKKEVETWLRENEDVCHELRAEVLATMTTNVS